MKPITFRALSATGRIVPRTPIKIVRRERDTTRGQVSVFITKRLDLQLSGDTWRDIEDLVMQDAAGRAGEIGIEDQIESIIGHSKPIEHARKVRQANGRITEANDDLARMARLLSEAKDSKDREYIEQCREAIKHDIVRLQRERGEL